MKLKSLTIAISNRFIFLLAALFIVLPVAAQTLPAGQSLEREMTGAETHRYQFDLQANEFFQVRVEQQGVDITLKLLDAGGKTLATMDSPNDKEGFETLTWVAGAAGNFVLEAVNFDAKINKGNYSIKREKSRPANDIDKKRVEIEKIFVEGITVFPNATSKELALEKFKQALSGWEELKDDYLINLTSELIKQFKQAPPEINRAIADIEVELQTALKALGDGQKLATDSNADSLTARDKINQGLLMFRAVYSGAKDAGLIDKIKGSGETAARSLNSLKILQFHSKIGEALSFDMIAQTDKNLGNLPQFIESKKKANGIYQEIISDKTFSEIR